ncbi:MAG TPA: HAMP domain-containing histidine kinase [Firmicutes bacterium]|nr:HAMP domain-containing histidine kinase [Bacillota bacterium]
MAGTLEVEGSVLAVAVPGFPQSSRWGEHHLVPTVLSWHELANRLSVIDALVQLLGNAPSERMHGYLEHLQQQVHSLRETVEEFSRLSASALWDQWEPVELPALLEAAGASLAEEASLRRISMNVMPDDSAPGRPVPSTVGNRSLLYTAFLNLMRNAIQFSPPGGAVTISYRASRRWFHLRIVDEGPGLPPSFTAGDLLPSQTAKPGQTTRPGGHGLGLYVSSVVLQEWHQGHLRLFNRRPRGALVYIRLPLYHPPACRPPANRERACQASPSSVATARIPAIT